MVDNNHRLPDPPLKGWRELRSKPSADQSKNKKKKDKGVKGSGFADTRPIDTIDPLRNPVVRRNKMGQGYLGILNRVRRKGDKD